jgi:hypothetical protein
LVLRDSGEFFRPYWIRRKENDHVS